MHFRKSGVRQIVRAGRHALLASSALAALAFSPAAQAVVPADGKTPSDIVDTQNVNGVGLMYRADGFVCTGTLVNPRTVLFAAHCVNDLAPVDYSTVNNGVPVAFAFDSNARPGLVNWLNSGFRTNSALNVFNVSNIAYHLDSLDPPAQSFLYGDVALATLDTPAADVPTWTLLFSALSAPSAISETTGTGYHVTLTGYGRSGSGTTGSSVGIDFRRRVAENFLGMLGSLDDIDNFLFGAPGGLNQNLYHTDFDDPKRQNPFDFDVFKDDASPNEGSTAGGDSGGPLILDRTFAERTVIGVLSGGSRYFLEQPDSSYGGTSFYQPLYLFWDWIAQNNPYRYATAKAGDGKWSDPNHWVTALDPNYRIIDANGRLVNGVPTVAGAGAFGDDPAQKFGQICYRPNGAPDDSCYDVGTDTLIVNGAPVPTSGPGSGSGTNGVAVAALPAATITNGLPGATGFVPNNIAPVASANVVGRYYDVTLSAAGRTTLDSRATVDRFTIAGAGATLDVTSAGSLTSLMDIAHLAGTVNVGGTIATQGDYFLMSGLLTGTGTVRTPFFTNVMGMVAPGGTGAVGTLTIDGNAILSSRSTLAIDIGSGVSDVIAVRGQAAIGGTVVFTPVAGTRPRFGERFTFLTAAGGVTGTFATAGPISAILRPAITYGATSASVQIDAGRYIEVINGGSINQTSYAHILDQNRSLYSRYAGLYDETDLLSIPGIQETFEEMAPRTETLRTSMGEALNDNMARFYRDRLAKLDGGAMGGTLTMTGQPLQLASASLNTLAMGMDQSGMSETATRENVLPEDVSAFIAGGYVDGKSMPMRGTAAGEDRFDGWYAAFGVEKALLDSGVVGLSASFSQSKGKTDFNDQARARLYQATLYGAFDLGGVKLDAVGSAGTLATRTRRSFAAGATAYTVRGSDQELALSGELGVSKALGTDALSIAPRASLRGAYIGSGNMAEYGGAPALVIKRHAIRSAQGRVGATAKADAMGIKPYVTANYVHEFNDQPAFLLANLVGGVGGLAPFALGGSDRNWGEVGGGLTIATGPVDLSLSADTTVWRRDVQYQSYRASVKIRF